MNESKKREWVKNAIIIFLVIMLILTFFSNTIMNYSLPEVSAQYVNGGTLSEQIRGSGTVEANQTYEVKIDETRTIASVEVAVGDVVEKGQTLFKLEDSESAELEAAEKALKSAQKAYNEALLSVGFDYRSDELEIEDKEEALERLRDELSKIAEYQEAYEKAKEKVKAIEAEIKTLEKEKKEYDEILSAIASEDYMALDTETYNSIKSAQARVEKEEKSKKQSEEKIQEYESEISSGGDAASIKAAKRAIEDKENEIAETEAQLHLENAKRNSGEENTAAELEAKLNTLKRELTNLQDDYDALLSRSSTYDRNKQLLEAEKRSLKNKQESYDKAKKNLEDLIASIKLNAKTKSEAAQDKIDEAEERLEETRSEASEAEKKAGTTVEDQEDKIRAAEKEIERLKLALSQQKEKDAVTASKDALNLQELLDAVTDAEKNVEKYKSKSVGAEITAQVGGKISAISCSAGEEMSAGSTVASIEMSDKGYTLEITVTPEQAKKVRVGDEANIQYFWYGDASAVLQSITSDKTNPAQGRILKFSVSGDVAPGQTLQIAMGSKGQRYEYIVPKSAVREDSNGKFVLVVVAKSSPLGNRYVAQRLDVEVLASDDTSSAVNGDFLGGEFIITTSTKPIEPGMQVRLVE